MLRNLNFDISQTRAGEELSPQRLGEIMRFLATELSPHTYVNLMAQYRPAGKVSSEKYPEINRGITPGELEQAYGAAREAGLHRFDMRGASREGEGRNAVAQRRPGAVPPRIYPHPLINW